MAVLENHVVPGTELNILWGEVGDGYTHGRAQDLVLSVQVQEIEPEDKCLHPTFPPVPELSLAHVRQVVYYRSSLPSPQDSFHRNLLVS